MTGETPRPTCLSAPSASELRKRGGRRLTTPPRDGPQLPSGPRTPPANTYRLRPRGSWVQGVCPSSWPAHTSQSLQLAGPRGRLRSAPRKVPDYRLYRLSIEQKVDTFKLSKESVEFDRLQGGNGKLNPRFESLRTGIVPFRCRIPSAASGHPLTTIEGTVSPPSPLPPLSSPRAREAPRGSRRLVTPLRRAPGPALPGL